MLLIKNILYGLVSGLTEFLPISSRGHQSLLRYMFGDATVSPLLDLLVHMGILVSVLVACWEGLGRLYREQNVATVGGKNVRHLDTKSYYDLRLLKAAIIPLIIGVFLFKFIANSQGGLLPVMGFFILNGIILLIVEHMRRGNRDAKTMSGFDGLMIGLAVSASVFPGLSGTGMMLSYSVGKGVDTQNAANWAILLIIPVMILAILADVISILSSGMGVVSATMVAGSVLSGIAAFCGGYVGISVLRLISANSGVFQFAYYSLGAALLTFVLYLLT